MAGNLSVGGIISGLDTNSLVTNLMQLERRPLVQLQSKQSSLQVRKAVLSDFGTKLTTLQGKLKQLLDATTYQARSTTTGDSKIATASAGANAAVQSFTVNVTTLATRTIVTGTSQVGGAVTGATVLSAATKFAVAPTAGSFSLSVGGVSKTFTVATSDTLQNVLDKLNAADGTGFGAGFATLAGNRITLTAAGGAAITLGSGADTSNFLAAVKLSAAPGGNTGTVTSTGPIGVAGTSASLSSANLAAAAGASGSFKINGVQINWTNADSLGNVITKINNAAAGVMASYDAATDKVTLQAKTTGATTIALQTVSGGDLLGAMGLAGATQTLGKNAQYDLGDGVQRYSTSNTISDAISGVSLTLAGQGSTTIGVTQNTATAVAAVRDFVNTYNAAADTISQQTAYDPDTKTAARFAGDALFRSVDNAMRQVVTTWSSTLTTYRSLPEIGISTGAFTTTASATKDLTLDETKLTAALQNNPQAVADLLTGSGGPVATLKGYLDSLTGDQGALGSGDNSTVSQDGKEIDRLGKEMDSLQARLDQREQSLRKQFTTLEQTMARLQAQSAQLGSQLASLNLSGSSSSTK